MPCPPLLPALVLAALLVGGVPARAQDAPADVGERINQERAFMRMGQPQPETEDCEFQRPPEDIAETAYLRNGYSAIRKILALEKWEETGSCECFYNAISWDDARAAADRFVTSSNPRVPFNVYEMQQLAQKLVARRAQNCAD